jgi:hypothetical protein
MVTKVASGVFLCLVFVVLACTGLVAQAPQISLSERSPLVQRANGPEPGLTKIHSNLKSKTDAYDDGISWNITGNENPQWGRGELAMPFTPKANSTAKEVLIALGYLGGGSNDGMISIFTDAGGVPGVPLKTWMAARFQREGSCCQLVAPKDRDGIPLQGGTQYWIVAASGPHSQASYQWNFVWNDAQGKVAFLNGNTQDEWLPYRDNVAAFAVYGTVP